MPDSGETLAPADALMALSRVITAVVARTLADATETVSVPQLRILVMLYYDGPVNLTTIARALGVDRSNASRPAERLVAAGLAHRDEDEADRRSATLSLSPQGRRLVNSVMERRRQLFDQLIDRLGHPERQQLVTSLTALLDVVGEDPRQLALSDAPGEPILPWIR